MASKIHALGIAINDHGCNRDMSRARNGVDDCFDNVTVGDPLLLGSQWNSIPLNIQGRYIFDPGRMDANGTDRRSQKHLPQTVGERGLSMFCSIEWD